MNGGMLLQPGHGSRQALSFRDSLYHTDSIVFALLQLFHPELFHPGLDPVRRASQIKATHCFRRFLGEHECCLDAMARRFHQL